MCASQLFSMYRKLTHSVVTAYAWSFVTCSTGVTKCVDKYISMYVD